MVCPVSSACYAFLYTSSIPFLNKYFISLRFSLYALNPVIMYSPPLYGVPALTKANKTLATKPNRRRINFASSNINLNASRISNPIHFNIVSNNTPIPEKILFIANILLPMTIHLIMKIMFHHLQH